MFHVDLIDHVRWRIHIDININVNAARTSNQRITPRHVTSRRITSHHIASYIVSYRISPALDGTAAVGMELTATEGAPDGTGVAVGNIQCSMLI